MKNKTPTHGFSCSFCEILYFIIFSSERLLLSMKGTKNCLFCRGSCKYGSAVKKERLYLIKFSTMIVKINALVLPWFPSKCYTKAAFSYFFHTYVSGCSNMKGSRYLSWLNLRLWSWKSRHFKHFHDFCIVLYQRIYHSILM